MHLKILSSIVTVTFCFLVTFVYAVILLVFKNQGYDDPWTYLGISLVCIGNLFLIHIRKVGFVVPSFALILLHAQATFFLTLPDYGDITVVSFMSFGALIWIFISFKWWHMILFAILSMIAISSRSTILHLHYLRGDVSLVVFQATISAYFLLVCIVVLSMLAYHFIDRENKLTEKSILSHRHDVLQMNSLLNAAALDKVKDDESRELRFEAFFDPLTGCLNRLAFNKLFSIFYEEHVNQNNEITFTYIDINHLKEVNDTLGHHTGDKYLTIFAEAIKMQLDYDSVFYRIGGDEFVLINVNSTDLRIIELLAKAQDSLTESSNALGFKGSFSYGLVTTKDIQGLSVDDILKLSDERMYGMKRKHHSLICTNSFVFVLLIVIIARCKCIVCN